MLCKGDSSIVCEAVVINFRYKFRSIIFKKRRPLTVQRVSSSCVLTSRQPHKVTSGSFTFVKVPSFAQGHVRYFFVNVTSVLPLSYSQVVLVF